MQHLDPLVLLAVLEEMLGPWLWVLLLAALAATVAFIGVVIRDRGFRSRRLVWSEVLAALGGGLAILAMQHVTHSSLADVGGPIDWIVGMAIFGTGAVGTLVAVYALSGLAGRLK